METKNFDPEDEAALFLAKIQSKKEKSTQANSNRQTPAPQPKPVPIVPASSPSVTSVKRGEVRDYVDPNEYYGYRPLSEKIIRKHESTKSRYTSVYKSKDAVFQDAITELCDQYKMHAKFKGGIAFITTLSGEWQFRYSDRPIQLFHSNAFKGRGDLHNQNIRFYSPVDVIRYIYFHERDRMKRLMSDTDEKNEFSV